MSFSVVNVVRNVSRAVPVSMRSMRLTKPITRSLWYISNPTNQFVPSKLSPAFKHTPLGSTCPCGECRGVHTRGDICSKYCVVYCKWSTLLIFKGDKELIEFLSEEIAVEKKGMSKSRDVSNLDGFEVKHNGAEIALSKKFNDEQ